MPVFDFPTGTVVPHASPTIPSGWVPCDGSSYDGTKAAYSNLWSVLGNTYGGSGQSSFNVPSLGGRVPVGPKASSGVSITNPSFATNTTGWSAGTAVSSTITRDTTTFDSSPAALRWDRTGASDALTFGSSLQGALSGTFTAGVTYTITWRMRAAPSSTACWLEVAFGVVSNNSAWVQNGTAFVQFNFDNFGTNNGQGASKTEWSLCSLNWTPTTTVSSGVNIAFYDKTSFFGTAGAIWMDSFSVASTEGDGGLGTWSGSTSHALSITQTGVKNHRHTITDPTHNHGGSAAGDHYHTVRYAGGNIIDTKNADASTYEPDGFNTRLEYTTTDGPSTVTFGSGTLNNIAVSSNTASHAGSAHTNVQPELALNYIIKL